VADEPFSFPTPNIEALTTVRAVVRALILTDAGGVVNILTLYVQYLARVKTKNVLTRATLVRKIVIPRAHNNGYSQGSQKGVNIAKENIMPVTKVEIPRVDPRVQYVGVSKLRTLNATNLHRLDKTLVIQDTDDKPLAVVLSFEQFLEMQNERDKILRTLETALTQDKADLKAALQDAADDNTTPISEVRKGLKDKREKNQQG
jgi:hypothetical protein